MRLACSLGFSTIIWTMSGKGKSGGVRVIYYWMKTDEQIFLLTIYGKSEKEDLTAQDLRKIAKLLEDLSNG